MIYQEPPQDEGRLLVLAMRAVRTSQEQDELLRLWSALGEERARSAAKVNQVEPLVGVGLAAAGARLPPAWSEAVEANGRRVEALVDALAAVVARLDAEGVPSAAIEAGGVLLGSDLDPRGYCPGDIDLLVQEGRWETVERAFAAEGFTPSHRRAPSTRRIEFRRVVAGREQWLEAGFSPFDRRWVPLALTDRSQRWLGHRVPARKGRGLWVLEPSEALAFVAIHTSLHSFVRAPGLRLHIDVDRLVRDAAVDWRRFVEEVQAAGAATRAAASLAMARGLLGTPVTDAVLASLRVAPGRWAAVRRLLEREGAVSTGRGKLGPLRTVQLDALLDDRGVLAWARGVFWPDDAWLREHFATPEERASGLRLQLRRYTRLLSRWRPR